MVLQGSTFLQSHAVKVSMFLFLSELRQVSTNSFLFSCRNMAKMLRLCEVQLFFTSSNSCHHTTVLNLDVENCYTMLKVVICN